MVRPFVSWVGGKTTKISIFRRFFPTRMTPYYYVEPFVGSGSFFFHFSPKWAYISDYNENLINAYMIIRNHVDELVMHLKLHDKRDSESYYLEIRDRYNANDGTPIKRASYFIYLISRSFNSVYRENANGEFNVSYGHKIANKRDFTDVENYKIVSKLLQRKGITIAHASYEESLNAIKNINRRKFVYLDPPYYPITETASFTQYLAGGWSDPEFKDLRAFVDDLDEHGIKFVLSNSYCPFIKRLFDGYERHVVKIPRMISCKSETRKPILEYVIMNYKIKTLDDFIVNEQPTIKKKKTILDYF